MQVSSGDSRSIRKLFISEVEVESAYGIPRKTLQNWRVLGRGPQFKRFGRRVLYGVDALERWVEARPTGGDGIPAGELRGAR